jgi:hypothetical protein
MASDNAGSSVGRAGGETSAAASVLPRAGVALGWRISDSSSHAAQLVRDDGT